MFYNAMNPAPGVKVYGVPMPNVHVSQAVRLAMCTPLTNHRGQTVGVLKQHMSGGGQTIGIISTVRSCPSMVIPVRGRDQSVKDRPAGRRRSPKMRPFNPVFQGSLPSNFLVRKRDAEQRMHTLRKMRWSMLKYKGHGVSKRRGEFDRLALQFLALYPEHVGEMRRIFQAQASSKVR